MAAFHLLEHLGELAYVSWLWQFKTASLKSDPAVYSRFLSDTLVWTGENPTFNLVSTELLGFLPHLLGDQHILLHMPQMGFLWHGRAKQIWVSPSKHHNKHQPHQAYWICFPLIIIGVRGRHACLCSTVVKRGLPYAAKSEACLGPLTETLDTEVLIYE